MRSYRVVIPKSVQKELDRLPDDVWSRSVFFAQPGKAYVRRLRASRTRLLMTT